MLRHLLSILVLVQGTLFLTSSSEDDKYAVIKIPGRICHMSYSALFALQTLSYSLFTDKIRRFTMLIILVFVVLHNLHWDIFKALGFINK